MPVIDEMKAFKRDDERYADVFGATNIEDVTECLDYNENDVGYYNFIEEDIVNQMQG